MGHAKRFLFLAVLAPAAIGATLTIAVGGSSPASRHEALARMRPSILRVPVSSFKVQNASMAEALLKLRSSDVSHIVIGFERIPHPAGEKAGPISVTLKDTKLGAVIDRLCRSDPRYEYKVVEGRAISPDLKGSMIEVLPRGAASNPKDLLNIKVSHYRVEARSAGAEEAIRKISEDAPELRQFLYRKHEEWLAKTGREPGGAPGSIVSGNRPPPPLILELHNVTVRQILDAISLKSIQRFKEGKNYAPVGWEYNFIIHPNASTGLGGHPQFKTL